MIDVKQAFRSEGFEIHGFRFIPSEKSFQHLEKRVCHTEIGVDDANSKGYIIEISSDGSYTVFDISTKNRVEVKSETSWSYDDLVLLLRKYGSLTGDIRDIRA
jgi:hypothetical protein